MRRQLVGAFDRIQSLEFPGGKATFATLADYKKMIAAVQDAGFQDDKTAARSELTEFKVVAELAAEAPGQAIIGAWGLLEYQLNVAADRIDPDGPHGWPQVARSLETWDKWPILYPVVLELRWLRDYTARSSRAPSSADAARYVSTAQDLAATLRTEFTSPSRKSSGGET